MAHSDDAAVAVAAQPAFESRFDAGRLTVIRPRHGWAPLDFRELWEYRELLYFLVWRDVKVRYKQTFLGIAWAVFRPFVSMVIFTVIFGGLAKIKSGSDVPYSLFVFAGLLPWMYFASALGGTGGSVVANASLVTKAYFPRVLMPVAAAVVPLVDFLFSLTVFVAMFAWYGQDVGVRVVLAPLFLAVCVLTAFGIGLWLSALNVRFRDVVFVLPFLTQIWMYVTPVIYPVTLIPERWRWLLALNPLTPAVEGFRWATVGGGAPSVLLIGVGTAVALIVAASGAIFFRRAERVFADVI